MGRRAFVGWAWGLCTCMASLACGAALVPGRADAPDGATEASVVDSGRVPTQVTVIATFDLPRGRTTRAISGTVFDETSGTLLAILDGEPALVTLTPSADFRTWSVGALTPVTGRGTTGWDAEGLARVGDTLYAITDETSAVVEAMDLSGKVRSRVTLPPVWSKIRPGNKGIESLASSPSGKILFLANEQALTVDGSGPTKERGSIVRILKRTLSTSTDTVFAYRTDPLGAGTGGDMGVSEIVALGDSDLLVLERGFQSDFGNTVRLYRVSLASGGLPGDVAAVAADAKVLAKELLVDFATLDCGGCTHPSRQPNPILDNYEALAIGPRLNDGRRLLFVTSDDNGSTSQVPRILVLGIRGLH